MFKYFNYQSVITWKLYFISVLEKNGLHPSNKLISDSLFYNLGLYCKNEKSMCIKKFVLQILNKCKKLCFLNKTGFVILDNMKSIISSNEYHNVNEFGSARYDSAQGRKHKTFALEIPTYDVFSSNDIRDSDYSSCESSQSLSIFSNSSFQQIRKIEN